MRVTNRASTLKFVDDWMRASPTPTREELAEMVQRVADIFFETGLRRGFAYRDQGVSMLTLEKVIGERGRT